MSDKYCSGCGIRLQFVRKDKEKTKEYKIYRCAGCKKIFKFLWLIWLCDRWLVIPGI